MASMKLDARLKDPIGPKGIGLKPANGLDLDDFEVVSTSLTN